MTELSQNAFQHRTNRNITLHKRYEINAFETYFIESYNFREGLTSENAAFLLREQFSLQT